MPRGAYNQIRFVTTIVAAAAGLNAGAKERIAWCKDIEENHNATVKPFPVKGGPNGERLDDKYRLLF